MLVRATGKGSGLTARSRMLRTLGAFVLLAAVAGPAGAQTGEAPAPATETPADGQVDFQRRTQLSPQEEVVESGRMLTRMEGAASQIRKQLEQAREQRDVVKTLCLNDKLSQVDVAIRSARDRANALKAAAQRGDSELANHEFTILTVLRQRSEQLTAEANQCIGEESAFIGETKTTMVVDPSLPEEDTTAFPPSDPTLVTEPPRCTSCSR